MPMRTFLRPHRLRIVLAAGLLGLVMPGCSDQPPDALIGTWENPSSDGMDGPGMSLIYTFARDGTLDIAWTRPLQTDTVLQANYRMQWDSVLTLSDARGSEQFIAHVIGDTLILRSDEGIVQLYARQP